MAGLNRTSQHRRCRRRRPGVIHGSRVLDEMIGRRCEAHHTASLLHEVILGRRPTIRQEIGFVR